MGEHEISITSGLLARLLVPMNGVCQPYHQRKGHDCGSSNKRDFAADFVDDEHLRDGAACLQSAFDATGKQRHAVTETQGPE